MMYGGSVCGLGALLNHHLLVFLAGQMYTAGAGSAMEVVGETEFVQGVAAASASGKFGAA
jgi:hypothetical protein